MKLLVEGKEWELSVSDFPILIHGVEGSGASYFSIVLAANTFLSGSQILFFTLKTDARELFEGQIGELREEIALISNQDEFEINKEKRGVIIKSGDKELCKFVLKSLPKTGRVIFIKNAESLLDEELLSLAKQFSRFILSGDFGQSEFLKGVTQGNFQTRIYFPPFADERIPEVPKKQGYIVSPNCQGIIQAVE